MLNNYILICVPLQVIQRVFRILWWPSSSQLHTYIHAGYMYTAWGEFKNAQTHIHMYTNGYVLCLYTFYLSTYHTKRLMCAHRHFHFVSSTTYCMKVKLIIQLHRFQRDKRAVLLTYECQMAEKVLRHCDHRIFFFFYMSNMKIKNMFKLIN